MDKNNKMPKKKGSGIITILLFGFVTGLGIFFTLLATNVIPGKQASDAAMWGATAFCYVIGVPGLYISISAQIKEKIAKKRFKEKGIKEEDYIPEEVMVFKNAIPELNKKNNLDISNEEMKTYIFKQVRRSIVTFKCFDENNNLVYDSHRLNKTFFVPLKVEFNNHISNKTFTHIIGRVAVGNGGNNMYFMKTPFSFRTDNLTIDDYCKMLNIQMTMTGTDQYDVRYKNGLIGGIKWFRTKRLVQPSKKVDPIYIRCTEDYLDTMFFLCFAYGFCGRDFYTTKTDVTEYGRM